MCAGPCKLMFSMNNLMLINLMFPVSFCVSQVGGKDNPAVDPIIHGLKGVVHHGKWTSQCPRHIWNDSY